MPQKAQPNQARTHLKEIILLFSVPIGVIALVIAFLYIPRLFAHPEHDFIYCEGYYCENAFSVDSNGHLVTKNTTDTYDRYAYREYSLRYYDVAKDSSRPVQPEDAQNYLLDPSSKSPDGYVLRRTANNGGFLLYGSYNSGWSLNKGLISKPLTFNSNDITFIGWISKASWTAS